MNAYSEDVFEQKKINSIIRLFSLCLADYIFYRDCGL